MPNQCPTLHTPDKKVNGTFGETQLSDGSCGHENLASLIVSLVDSKLYLLARACNVRVSKGST